jgi:hypothetical protein
MMHTPGHKWNPVFQEGVQVGQKKLAHTLLDIINEEFAHAPREMSTQRIVFMTLDKLEDYLDSVIKQ